MTKKIVSSPKKLPAVETSDAGAGGFVLGAGIDDDEDDVYDSSPYLRQVLPSWGWDIIKKYELQASETPVEAVTSCFSLRHTCLRGRACWLAGTKQ